MSLSFRTLTARLFRRNPGPVASPNLARLGVTQLEDRTVPTAVVSVVLDGSWLEGATGELLFSRSGDIGQGATIAVSYSGTATPGVDYIVPSSTVTFEPDQVNAFLSVSVLADQLDEGQQETIVVTIVNGGGMTIGSPGSVTAHIYEPSPPPPPVVTVTKGADAVEGGADGTFHFNRPTNLTESLTVYYSVGGTAVSGTDYAALSGTITFPAASTVVGPIAPYEVLYLTAFAGDATELDETVTVVLIPSGAYDIGSPSSATLKIEDEQKPVVSVIKLRNVLEGDIHDAFRFARTGDLSNLLNVSYSVAGTATPGSDYFDLSGSVSFAIGEAVVDVRVPALPDDVADLDETVVVMVTPNASYATSGTSATVTIIDVRAGGVDGVVWVDGNGSGTKDVGEAALPGTAVRLEDINGTLVGETTTASDGSYSFSNLYPTAYLVRFTAPSGFIMSGNANTWQAVADIQPAATTPLNLAAYPSTQAASVSGHVWAYLAPGAQGPAVGVSGVSVTLLSATGGPATNASGNPVPATTTGSDGAYAFANLAPGSYSVQFSAPSGHHFSGSDQATLKATASTPGPNATADAVAYQLASLSGVIWRDENLDGQRNTGEAGVPGAIVELLDLDLYVVATTVTSAVGTYYLSGLRPSDYLVRFISPAGDERAGMIADLSLGSGAAATLTAGYAAGGFISDNKKPGIDWDAKPAPVDPGVGRVDYTTFRQTSRLNCWVAATVVSFAKHNPEKIREMIKNNGNGTFTVTLANGKAHTVNPSTDKPSFVSDGQWAACLELALIAEMGERAKTTSGFNDYGDVIPLLTGHADSLGRNALRQGFGDPFGRMTTEDMLRQANSGKVVIIGTGKREPRGTAKEFVQMNHTYAVLWYDKDTKRVHMRNPHGSADGKDGYGKRKEPGYAVGEFWLTLDEVNDTFLGLAYEKNR